MHFLFKILALFGTNLTISRDLQMVAGAGFDVPLGIMILREIQVGVRGK